MFGDGDSCERLQPGFDSLQFDQSKQSGNWYVRCFILLSACSDLRRFPAAIGIFVRWLNVAIQ